MKESGLPHEVSKLDHEAYVFHFYQVILEDKIDLRSSVQNLEYTEECDNDDVVKTRIWDQMDYSGRFHYINHTKDDRITLNYIM